MDTASSRQCESIPIRPQSAICRRLRLAAFRMRASVQCRVDQEQLPTVKLSLVRAPASQSLNSAAKLGRPHEAQPNKQRCQDPIDRYGGVKWGTSACQDSNKLIADHLLTSRDFKSRAQDRRRTGRRI